MVRKSIVLGMVLAAVLLGLPRLAAAASACYMKIEGVKGESQDSRHKDWIEIESYSPTTFRSTTSVAGQPPARAKDTPGSLTIVKAIDSASPHLARVMAEGKHIPKATLSCRKAGREEQKYFHYQFFDLSVSSIEPQGAMEQISFNYQKVSAAAEKPKETEKPDPHESPERPPAIR
jgi:type VI secretion system secreted protein Hcp